MNRLYVPGNDVCNVESKLHNFVISGEETDRKPAKQYAISWKLNSIPSALTFLEKLHQHVYVSLLPTLVGRRSRIQNEVTASHRLVFLQRNLSPKVHPSPVEEEEGNKCFLTLYS